MNSEAAKALSLLNLSMPQQGSLNTDAYLAALELAVDGCCDEAIIDGVKDCLSGKALDVTNGFCPSPDRFGEYIRLLHKRKQAVKAQKERLQLPAPSIYSKRESPFDKASRKCWDEGRELLEVGVGLQEFKRRCGAIAFPVGSIWIVTGEVFGPNLPHDFNNQG